MNVDERNQSNPQQDDGLTDDERDFATFLKASEEAKKEEAPQAPEAQDEPEAPAEPKAQTPAQVETKPPADDWMASLAEDVRERVRQEIEQREQQARKFEAQWKAQRGQLAPTQQKLAELERQLAEAKKAQPKPEGMTQTQWDRYQKEFPEDSQAFLDLVTPIKEELRQTREQLAEIANERQVAAAVTELSKLHPDWQTYDTDPVFGEWFDALDPIVKDQFPEGGTQDPRKVAWLISQFKRDEQMAELYWQSQQAQTAAPVVSAKAAQVVAKRDQQRKDPALGIKSGQSAPVRRNGPVDPDEEEFAAFLQANPPR